MYNIRVYGIFHREGMVLASDEYMKGVFMTKFPGGGHELGESLPDTLRREFREEFGQEIKILRHFYTTDFFVSSAFSASQQLISVYYLIEPAELSSLPVRAIPFDFPEKSCNQSLRWISLKETNPEVFTFVIDRHVFELLKNTMHETQE